MQKLPLFFLFCILHLTLRVFFEALFLSVHFKLSSSITQNRVFEYSFFYFWLHHFCSFFTMADGLLTDFSILLSASGACRKATPKKYSTNATTMSSGFT
jgi:hypothetical protein